MPIIDLQQRMRQIGEIRIGHVVPTKSGKTRPEKLSKFRFTSPSEQILADVANEYGGKVEPWTPANGGPQEFEVYTDTNRLPVVIPPMAVTQWYELYQGSKCVRRCDGRTEQKSDRPCLCDPENRDCAITTRLNVMLRDVGPIGYWLLTSRGYYAAVELPPIAELLARGGGNVPGFLGLEERREIHEKPGGGTETRRFMVPTLDIGITAGQALQGSSGGGQMAVEAPQPAAAAIAAPRPGYEAMAAAVTSIPQLQELWRQAVAAGHLDDNLKALLTARANELKAAAEAPAAEPDVDGVVDGEVVPDPPAPADPAVEVDPDAVWQQIVTEGGRQGYSLPDLQDHFSEVMGGLTADSASGAELQAYLEKLRSGGNSGDEPEAVPA